MRNKYKTILYILAAFIVLVVVIGVGYLFYNKVVSPSTEVVVDDNLSINFIDGTKVSGNGTYTFSITNNSSNDVYFNIYANKVSSYDGDATYTLTSSEANINITSETLNDTDYILADNILIRSGITEKFTLTLENNTNMKFQIQVKSVKDAIEYFYSSIIKNNNPKKNSTTKIGEEIAETNEGLIENLDDDGTTYYFRGKVENNYVSFAGSLWRIIRINGDGTVRMILNESTGELSNYHNEIETIEGQENTTIMNYLNNYYNTSLKSYDELIANSKFCKTNLSTSNEKETNYDSYFRIATNKNPTFNCLGEKYASKIGLITADEVVFAGATTEDDNEEYYLYNDDIESIWWTSTLAKKNDTEFYPFSVTIYGKLSNEVEGKLYRSVRPVINIVKKVTVSGKGTKDEPYIINE